MYEVKMNGSLPSPDNWRQNAETDGNDQPNRDGGAPPQRQSPAKVHEV
jgi:hypothetical protein